jgi:hypothetical protein
MRGFRQHTLLGIIIRSDVGRIHQWVQNNLGKVGSVGFRIGLFGTSGNTLYWLLLLVNEGPRTTHFTGYCCGLCEVSGNTFYWASLGLMWAAFIN